MKIPTVETIRLDEFASVLWVRIRTDCGLIGIGETFYGPHAVETHIHEALTRRLLGAGPLRIEALNRSMITLPVAHSALWDLFGKHCHQTVHQMLGGACFEELRIYNTCAGYRYVLSGDFRATSNWDVQHMEWAVQGFGCVPSRCSGGKPARERHLRHEDLAVPLGARENRGDYTSAERMRTCLEPFRKIRKAVGDRIDIMVEFHSLWNLVASLEETWNRRLAAHNCIGPISFATVVHNRHPDCVGRVCLFDGGARSRCGV